MPQGSHYIPLPTSADSPDDDTPSTPLLSPAPTPHGGLTVNPDATYSYSYGPPGLAGLWHNYYALLCAVFASLGGLSFGYDQGVIANVLVMQDFVRRWPVTPLQKGALTAVLGLGALFGALSSGVLADKYSRRHSIFFACVIFTIGALLQTFATALSHLFLGRAIGGIGVGALSMLSPLYIAEISPPEVRGSLIALEQFSIVLGVVVGFWIGFFTREVPGSLSWRLPLGVQIIPGILLAVGAIFLLPPSPRLLVLKGRYEEAEASLVKLRNRDDALTKIELLEMRVEATLITEGNGAKYGGVRGELAAWGRLLGRRYRKRTLVGVLMMVFQQWSGINALLYYGPTLVRSIGLQGETVGLLVSGGIGIVQFVAVGPAVVWIDRVGRKPLLRGGSAVMCAAHMLIAFLVQSFQADWPAHSGAAWVAVIGIYTFTFAYGVSFGPIGWVLPSEVFPLSVRGRGVALSTASNWVNNFLIGLITPVMMEFSAAGTFLTFATACFLAYLWATYSVPETAGVALEDMDRVFGGEVGREEGARRVQVEEELGLRAEIDRLVGTREA
ncbi:MFS monosaccharide transporter [Roridomyces roridus]|uniref:MFS monosaccharide transporter n=1 Tax=Roridomyces roridus TaxID=1738132 RepID=A0AAD7BPY1_9AGAR|nr:MFS monosaccharide transporter [Roridomyces roridus]